MLEKDNRRTYLIREVAIALDQHINPFSLRWLDDRGATHESAELMDTLAAILFGYLTAGQEVRDSITKAYASRSLMEVIDNMSLKKQGGTAVVKPLCCVGRTTVLESPCCQAKPVLPVPGTTARDYII